MRTIVDTRPPSTAPDLYVKAGPAVDRVSGTALQVFTEQETIPKPCFIVRVWRQLVAWASALIQAICSLFQRTHHYTAPSGTLLAETKESIERLQIDLNHLSTDIATCFGETFTNLNHLNVIREKIGGIGESCFGGLALCKQLLGCRLTSSERQEVKEQKKKYEELQKKLKKHVQENKQTIQEAFNSAEQFLQDKLKKEEGIADIDLDNYRHYRECLKSFGILERDPQNLKKMLDTDSSPLLHAQKEWIIPHPGKILNIGNSCYMSACLQALFATQYFLNLLDLNEEEFLTKMAQQDENAQKIAHALKTFFSIYKKSKQSRPDHLRNAVVASRLNSDLAERIYDQKDSMQLMRLLLGIFKDVGVEVEEKRIGANNEEMRKRENAFEISLGIQGPTSLQALVTHYFTEETIHDSIAFGDAKYQQYQKKSSITKDLGGPLVLSLKRFVYNPQRQEVEKVHTPITLPEDGILDLSSAYQDGEKHRFQIVSCIRHFGRNVTQGHYIAYTLYNKKWFSCSDTIIEPATFAELQNEKGGQNYTFVLEKI